MIVVFFVTSADSGARVVNMLASHGKDDTPAWQRVYWTGSIGLVAAILLVAGGLPSLQTAAIASALPFSIVLIFAIWGLIRALRADLAKRDALIVQTVADSNTPWQDRLDNLFHYATKQSVADFQQTVVVPAFQSFAAELENKGLKVKVAADHAPESVRIEVYHGDELDFAYSVRADERPLPDNNLGLEGAIESEKYWRAEVHLSEGGQDYDIMGWNQEQVVNDLLAQYERHLNYLHIVR
jgi:choline/glycine/proline betaine transport protein